jgi:uncharacterized protein (DUF2252 family)
VQIVGDPHLENISTFQLADGSQAVEFNDFDAALYGGYHTDVWRLSASWHTFGLTSSYDRLEEDDWLAVAESCARGYADEIIALAADGSRTLALTGQIFEDILEEAIDDGQNRTVLERYTAIENGGRQLLFGEIANESGEPRGRMEPLSLEESRWIDSSLRAWQTTLPEVVLGPLKGAGRRYGSGVASLPVRRYFLLFEGESDSQDDDRLIEWKETRDPILMGTGAVEIGRLFDSNAQRVTVLQRRAHSVAETDPYAGWVGQEPWSFRSRRRSGYHQALDRDRIVRRLRDGRWNLEDLQRAAYESGMLLAHSHARAQTLDGLNAASAIAAAIGDDAIGFALEARDRAALLGPRIEEDYRLFQLLLAESGPSLGFSP